MSYVNWEYEEEMERQSQQDKLDNFVESDYEELFELESYKDMVRNENISINEDNGNCIPLLDTDILPF